MNSLLRIRVQVIAREAAKLTAISTALDKIAKASGAANAALGSLSKMGASAAGLSSAGKALDTIAAGLGRIGAQGKSAVAALNAVNRLSSKNSMKGGKSISSSTVSLGALPAEVTRLNAAFMGLGAGGAEARKVLLSLNAIINKSDADFTQLRKQISLLGLQLESFGRLAAGAVAPMTALAGAMKAAKGGNTGAALSGATSNLKAYGAAAKTADVSMRSFFQAHGWGRRTFTQWSKDLQWVGRQIEFNFTLPIVLATGLATKWAMEAEKGMTRLKKVYGDGATGAQQFAKDQADLRKAMIALSDIFGVSQGEVNSLAADWAAAGLVAGDLARAVRNTLEAVVVGDFDSTQSAFEALVQVQSAYNLSSQELRQSLAILNTIENETAANFQDLTQGIARSGGAARTAGVDIRHLAAMMSVLVPATGSAESAGNSLKTIFSRLLAPTEDAKEAMSLMGIAFNDASWQAKNGVERIESMAVSFEKLTSAQQAVVSAYIASRYQINRFDTLMRDVIDKNGSYQRSLNATADSLGENSTVMQRYVNEIGTFLSSSPQAFKILTTQLQNSLIQAITPMIPAILGIIARIRDIARAFSELSPATQQLIMLGIVALAAAGTFMRLFGAAGLLLGMIGKVIKAIGLLGAAFIKLAPAILANPFTWLILALAAVVIAITVFRDQIDAALASVEQSFSGLPRAIIGALRAVVRTVAAAAMAVYEWLQWMNPFARHSPSLVEQVTKGVDIIAKKYASLTGLSVAFRRAAADFRVFLAATEDARNADTARQRGEQRSQIVSASPGAGPATDALYGSVDALRSQLDLLAAEIRQQDVVVAAAKEAWDDLARQVDAAKDAYDAFIQPYDDKINDLAMQQKRLRLEMMRMEDAGQTWQSLKDLIAGINGDIEQLRGKAIDLRANGAGSDVTGPIMQQIAALESQRRVLEAQAGSAADLQDQLDKLAREQDLAELERDVAADPYLRQIAALEDLQDAAKATYDLEKDKLDALTQVYDDIEQQIRDIEQALNDMAQAAERAASAASGAGGGGGGGNVADSFGAAAAGDFETPGGSGFATGTEDLATLADQWAKEAEGMFKNLDIFAPFKDGWAAFTGWLGDAFDRLHNFFNGGDGMGGIAEAVQTGWDHVVEATRKFLNHPVMKGIANAFSDLWAKIAPSLAMIWQKVVELVGLIIGKFREWGDLFEPLIGAIKNLAIMFGIYLTAILTVWSVVWTALQPLIEPILNVILGVVGFFLDTLHAIIKIVLGLISLDFGAVWDGIKEYLGAWVDLVLTLFRGFGDIALAVLEGAWNAIKKTTGMIWDAIKKVIEFVWDGIQKGIDNAINTVKGTIGTVLESIKLLWSDAWNAVSSKVSEIWETVKTVVKVAGAAVWIAVNDFLNNLSGIWQTIWNSLGGVVSAVWTKISDIVGWIANSIEWVIDKIKTMIDWAKKAAEAAKSVVPGGGGGGRSLLDPFGINPFLDTGGILPGPFTQPIPIVAHGSEMILNPRQQSRLFAMANGKGDLQGNGSGSDNRTIVFNGDLSFPNVKNGDDADAFLRNLNSLVKH